MALQKGWISYDRVGKRRRKCPHLYVCHYCPKETGPDGLSSSLLRFKAGKQPDKEVWIKRALQSLDGAKPEPGMLIVRALHHGEVCLTGREGTSLDVLGRRLAQRFGGTFAPDLLRKRRVTRAFTGLHTKVERCAELQEVYYVREDATSLAIAAQTAPRVLLLDDIITTGATASAILSVLETTLPGMQPLVFSLALASLDHSRNRVLEDWLIQNG